MKKATPVAVAATTVAILAGGTWYTLTRQLEVGQALYAAGCRQSLYIPTEDVNARRTATFNPEVPFDGVTPGQFAARYGVPLTAVKGSTVGERYSRDGLTDWLMTKPLGLEWPRVVTAQDDTDAKYVTCDGRRAVWDSLISPPIPAPTPSPTPIPPGPDPTPAPTQPPPAGGGRLVATEFPCPGDSARSTAQLCLSITEVP